MMLMLTLDIKNIQDGLGHSGGQGILRIEFAILISLNKEIK